MVTGEIQQLKEAGIDVEASLERFLGNAELLKKFLRKFSEDQNFKKLELAIGCGDCEEAFVAAHTLKGVTGNLSMTALYHIISEQVEFLRSNNLEEATKMMPEVKAEYERISARLDEILG